MNRRRLAERAILLAGGTVGLSVKYDPNRYGHFVTEDRWLYPKYSACQDLPSRLALEACGMKQGMPWCNRVDGGNKWIPGMNLIRIKQNAPYAWKSYGPHTKWDVRLGDAVEILNNFGGHTFVVTNISYDANGNPSFIDSADYGQFHAAGGAMAAPSARCYMNRPVGKNPLGWTISGFSVIGRLDIMALREAETGLAESDTGASPGPIPEPTGPNLSTVLGVQKALNILGETPPLKEDGWQGQKTNAAIEKFQAAHGLKVDHIVGTKTKAALKLALSEIGVEST